MEDVRDLNRRIYDIEDKLQQLQWDRQHKLIEPFTPPYNPGGPFGPNTTTGWPGTNDPTKPKPMWGPGGLIEGAGDDPSYKGAQGAILAEEFIKELEKR
jgi:hypothetical protein